jgi:23S rRNA (pseudouridine1915-N3)-methyltransferase
VRITIISVGSAPRAPQLSILQEFVKRLPPRISVEWRYVKHAQGNQANSMAREAEDILRNIPKGSSVFLLDESGTTLDSPTLSRNLFSDNRDKTFIIGGAYGVADSVKKHAHYIWSLSQLVFPHQLVRIILIEQIYRAYTIYSGHPYHHS